MMTIYTISVLLYMEPSVNYLWLERAANYFNAALSAQFNLLQKFDAPILKALQLCGHDSVPWVFWQAFTGTCAS